MANRSPLAHAASRMLLRSSSETASALVVEISPGTPPWVHLASSRYSAVRPLMAACFSAGIGPLKAGMEKLGVRWKTVRVCACSAMMGIDWMADEPVPMTPTRLPVRSTPSWGQLEVK